MSDQAIPSEDRPHDILAAEAFAMPMADPSLHHEPISLPDDPTGIAEPHDVLAAEEFAMPAPRGASESGGGPLALAGQAASPARVGIAAGLALLALIVFRRRRR